MECVAKNCNEDGLKVITKHIGSVRSAVKLTAWNANDHQVTPGLYI